MNERIKLLAHQADWDNEFREDFDIEKFAELIIKECIDTLLWHGCDDAVPYIEWMATNKLGVKP